MSDPATTTKQEIHGQLIVCDYDEKGKQRFRVCPPGKENVALFSTDNHGTVVKAAKALNAVRESMSCATNFKDLASLLRTTVSELEKVYNEQAEKKKAEEQAKSNG